MKLVGTRVANFYVVKVFGLNLNAMASLVGGVVSLGLALVKVG